MCLKSYNHLSPMLPRKIITQELKGKHAVLILYWVFAGAFLMQPTVIKLGTHFPYIQENGKYEGYSESSLWWAVKKTSNEKKILLYTKNKYILKLLLNVVTAWIEALVIPGNKFSYACVKEVCCHWSQPRFDTFHQLLIIAEPILCKTCDSLAYPW
jgi:hypothetical protein